MGGVYIRCGSFEGEDKSGSAIDGLLDELFPLADAGQRHALSSVRRALQGEADGDFGRIAKADAAALAPLLQTYVAGVHSRYGPLSDPFELVDRDFAEDPSLDPTDAKYGKSRGWRLYCATDLLEACKTSAREHEDVILTWD
jgi:hypothetical protein